MVLEYITLVPEFLLKKELVCESGLCELDTRGVVLVLKNYLKKNI